MTETYHLPASFAQERMWLLEQLEDGAPTYNSQLGLRFSGPLDVPALERAVAALVGRHEALRTTFDDSADELAQVIGTDVPADLVVHRELSAAANPDADLAATIDAELRVPFDLSTGPVLRVLLVRLRLDEHVLLLTLDHLTCDAWSMGVLHRDLIALYTAEARGGAVPAEPAVQYADFAVWQREWLRGAELERQLRHWRTLLAAPPPVIRFPETSAEPHGRSRATAVQPLPESLTAELMELGHKHNASLFMVLTAAFVALFGRYSGQTDLVLGTVVANRAQSEVDDVVGLFANTVALRLDLTGAPATADLIARTRAAVLDAQTHQHVPFDHVVADLAPARAGARAPFFNAIVEHTDIDREPATVGAVRVDPMPLATLPIPVELVVNLRREAGVLQAIWHHDSEHLTPAAVAVMQLHLRAVLDGMIADAATPAAALPLPVDVAPGAALASVKEWGNDAADAELVDAEGHPAAVGVPGEVVLIDPDGSRRPTGIAARRRADGTLARADALPAAPLSHAEDDAVDPDLLAAVRATWTEVLAVASIAPDQDFFFDLGGHSLAASRVASRLRRSLGVEVRTRLLFEHPVLREFVAAVATLR